MWFMWKHPYVICISVCTFVNLYCVWIVIKWFIVPRISEIMLLSVCLKGFLLLIKCKRLNCRISGQILEIVGYPSQPYFWYKAFWKLIINIIFREKDLMCYNLIKTKRNNSWVLLTLVMISYLKIMNLSAMPLKAWSY